MNRSSFSILFASIYLALFLIAIQTGQSQLVWPLFLLSPFVVIYMVYSVLRFGKYSGKEMSEGEEWGYEDTHRENLGTF
jgi:O-antigen/teichoic acid export membrane protein